MKVLNDSHLLEPVGKALDQLKRVNPIQVYPARFATFHGGILNKGGEIGHVTHVLKHTIFKVLLRAFTSSQRALPLANKIQNTLNCWPVPLLYNPVEVWGP